jgi:hypothetical protein
LRVTQQSRLAERPGQKIVHQGQLADLGVARVFTSIAGFAGSAWPSNPKTPEAPSSNYPRQIVIWFGWTSNCCTSSASVFSPFTAAKATFALKAGLWFRRVPFVICSPVQQPSWPPSGRNST